MLGGLVAVFVLGLIFPPSISGSFRLSNVAVFWVVGGLSYVVLHLLSGAFLEKVAVARFGLDAKAFADRRAEGLPELHPEDEAMHARARSDPIFMISKVGLWIGKWWAVIVWTCPGGLKR